MAEGLPPGLVEFEGVTGEPVILSMRDLVVYACTVRVAGFVDPATQAVTEIHGIVGRTDAKVSFLVRGHPVEVMTTLALCEDSFVRLLHENDGVLPKDDDKRGKLIALQQETDE